MRNSRMFVERCSGVAVLVASTALAVIAYTEHQKPQVREVTTLPKTCEHRAPVVAEMLGVRYTSEEGVTEQTTVFNNLMAGCVPTVLCWTVENVDSGHACGSSEDLTLALRNGVAVRQVWVQSN